MQCKTSLVMFYEIRYNALGRDGGLAVVRGLRGATRLTTLRICANALGTDGATAVAEGLTDHRQLVGLDLDKNGVDAAGAWRVRLALHGIPDVKVCGSWAEFRGIYV